MKMPMKMVGVETKAFIKEYFAEMFMYKIFIHITLIYSKDIKNLNFAFLHVIKMS